MSLTSKPFWSSILTPCPLKGLCPKGVAVEGQLCFLGDMSSGRRLLCTCAALGELRGFKCEGAQQGDAVEPQLWHLYSARMNKRESAALLGARVGAVSCGGHVLWTCLRMHTQPAATTEFYLLAFIVHASLPTRHMGHVMRPALLASHACSLLSLMCHTKREADS